jgi:hypothetical protein
MARRGQQPGRIGLDLRGIEVHEIETLRQLGNYGFGRLGNVVFNPGWYLCVQFRRGNRTVWQAVLELRFVREKDGLLAAKALIAAGLDSAKRMKAAGGETVIRTAFEALQW